MEKEEIENIKNHKEFLKGLAVIDKSITHSKSEMQKYIEVVKRATADQADVAKCVENLQIDTNQLQDHFESIESMFAKQRDKISQSMEDQSNKVVNRAKEVFDDMAQNLDISNAVQKQFDQMILRDMNSVAELADHAHDQIKNDARQLIAISKKIENQSQILNKLKKSQTWLVGFLGLTAGLAVGTLVTIFILKDFIK